MTFAWNASCKAVRLCARGILACDILSRWHFILWHFVYVAFCLVAFCLWDVLSCDILSAWRFVLWHFVCGTFCPVTFCPVAFCPVTFCLVAFCPVAFCPETLILCSTLAHNSISTASTLFILHATVSYGIMLFLFLNYVRLRSYQIRCMIFLLLLSIHCACDVHLEESCVCCFYMSCTHYEFLFLLILNCKWHPLMWLTLR